MLTLRRGVQCRRSDHTVSWATCGVARLSRRREACALRLRGVGTLRTPRACPSGFLRRGPPGCTALDHQRLSCDKSTAQFGNEADMAYYDLGAYTRRITTESPDAQKWFDRGLNWVYAFNHGEAITCFQKALECDAKCAMAHWGIAYAAGPNYNLPWHLYDPAGKAQALATAFDATQAAVAHTSGVTPVEAALIKALRARYPQREAIEDQSEWDRNFTRAMRPVFEAHRDDLEVRTVFTEAIMNETPWQMWDLATGKPADGAGTEEAMALLESALRDQPAAWDHPGLLHLYVHLMEMSPFPQRAIRAGDRLRDIAPDAGHLIHMPTHIDMLCGNYHDVLVYNQ